MDDKKNRNGGIDLSDWEQASKWFDSRSEQLSRGEIPEVSAQRQRASAEGRSPLSEDRLPIRPRERVKKTASIKRLDAARQGRRDTGEKGSAVQKKRPPDAGKGRTAPRVPEKLSADDKRRLHAEEVKKKKKVKIAVGVTVSAVMALVTSVLLSLFVFFNIEAVEVSGESRYKEEQIVSASGIVTGENIFRVDREAAREKLCTALPYIGAVKISIKEPNTLLLTVTEATEKYALQYSKNFVLLDENDKVLSRIAKKIPAGAVKLMGVNFAQADVGRSIALAPDNEDKLDIADSILELCGKYGLSPVNAVGLENVSALYLIYDNRIRLNLGGEVNLKQKIEKGAQLVVRLDSENPKCTGAAMLSTPDRAYFKPGSMEAE